jgi:hypothetical protein
MDGRHRGTSRGTEAGLQADSPCTTGLTCAVMLSPLRGRTYGAHPLPSGSGQSGCAVTRTVASARWCQTTQELWIAAMARRRQRGRPGRADSRSGSPPRPGRATPRPPSRGLPTGPAGEHTDGPDGAGLGASVVGEGEPLATLLDEQWLGGRSGAIAGRGYHFQMWSGRGLPPESWLGSSLWSRSCPRGWRTCRVRARMLGMCQPVAETEAPPRRGGGRLCAGLGRRAGRLPD